MHGLKVSGKSVNGWYNSEVLGHYHIISREAQLKPAFGRR
jgi:hypothetical protein